MSSSSTNNRRKKDTRRSNSEPARLRGRRRSNDSQSESDDGGRIARDSPLLADEQPKLGGMARAAVEQWGLDEGRLLAWAAARRLPGIGVADVNLYRQENPDEDLSAEMNGDLLGT